MHLQRLFLLVTLLCSIHACSSQPLSPQDELAMELYRACMEGAPQSLRADDITLSNTGENTAGSINVNAQSRRDSRNAKDCQELARERSD